MKTFTEDTFMQCFLSDLCLRPSCHNCRFKDNACVADITIADAWGIDSWLPEMDDDKGTSLVLTHTDKGMALWEAIAQQTKMLQTGPKLLLRGNGAYWKPVKAHPNRKRFFVLLNKNAPWGRLVRLTRKPLYYRAVSKGKSVMKKLLKIIAGLVRKEH